MIVCLCHRISDRDIQRLAQHGMCSFDELQDETCIARNCACCEDSAREVFDDARRDCAPRSARPDRVGMTASA